MRRYKYLRPLRSLLVATIVLATGIVAADAVADSLGSPHVTAILLAETQSIVPGQPLQLALRQTIQPGWHTYWQNPGDAGLPTTITWSLPPGYVAEPIVWPTPQRMVEGPLVVFGYEGQVVLPIAVDVPKTLQPGSNAILTARASWLVCSDICVPEDADLQISLPVTAGPADLDPRWKGDFIATRSSLPVANPFPVKVTVDRDAITLHVNSGDATQLQEVTFLPVNADVIDIDKPQNPQVDTSGMTLVLPRDQVKAELPAQLSGVLTFRDLSTGGEGTLHAIKISADIDSRPAESAGGLGLLGAMLLGVLGGMLLNLMPCVLPILSIKALGLARQAHASPRDVKLEGFAYAAGVLVSFACLAGILIVFRSAGVAIGWGFQLQSPVFVTLMIYLLFAIGLNLSGVFSIGSQLANVGGELATSKSYFGSFFTGALATVVATPCTAPFMAGAVGYGITHPWYMSFGVFEAIGLGLALPYVVLAVSPATRRFLPKPGVWMTRLKEILAFPVYGTAVWLAFVLTEENGSSGITLALVGLVLIAFAAWLYETQQQKESPYALVRMISALVIVGALALPVILGTETIASPAATSTAGTNLGWQAYSPEKLQALVAAGKPVFVDVTADWCITCKVNERIAFGDPAVRQAFADRNIVALKADWTRRNPDITRVLEANGRGGIPLNLFYPGSSSTTGLAKPILLPQILTAANVLNVIQNSSGSDAR